MGWTEEDERRAQEVQKIVDKAVADEREACAKVADNFLGDRVVRDGIAAAIRART